MRQEKHRCAPAGSPGLHAWAFSLLLLASAQAWGQEKEILLRYGQAGGKYEGAGVALHLDSLWSRDLGNWKMNLMPELELTHFRYTGSQPGPDSLNEGGVKGMVRISRGGGSVKPYAEVGLGASLFSRDRLATKDFSTHFQFSEHVGLGAEFGNGWFAGWRYSHYSNAGIKQPNDGIDLHQLVIGVSF